MSPTCATLDRFPAISRQLEQHLAADRAEAEDRRRVYRLLERSASPLNRNQFDPGHVTASAIVLDPSLSRALLLHHEKLNRWLQPGGHLEPGERDPLEAARREALEETGLRTQALVAAPIDVDVHEIPARPTEPGHAHYDLRFLLVSLDPASHAFAGDGARAIRWIDLAVPDLEGLDPGLRRALRKAGAQRRLGAVGRWTRRRSSSVPLR